MCYTSLESYLAWDIKNHNLSRAHEVLCDVAYSIDKPPIRPKPVAWVLPLGSGFKSLNNGALLRSGSTTYNSGRIDQV